MLCQAALVAPLDAFAATDISAGVEVTHAVPTTQNNTPLSPAGESGTSQIKATVSSLVFRI